MKRTKKVNIDGPSLKIIPLGGLEQIGMNITAFEYEDSIVVVDCGLSFPAGNRSGDSGRDLFKGKCGSGKGLCDYARS